MNPKTDAAAPAPKSAPALPGCDSTASAHERAGRPACPVCGGQLREIRHKLVCSHCHTICETCCEGGRG